MHILAHSCWKQWMRYHGGADVDGICRPWTEVVFRGQKLYCGPWTEVVSHATPPHLVKVKVNFNEAQKLKKRRNYGIMALNHGIAIIFFTDLNNLEVNNLISFLINHSICPIFCIVARTVTALTPWKPQISPPSSEKVEFCSLNQNSLITSNKYLFWIL